MIDLLVGVLQLERHHVEHVIALDRIRDHTLDMIEPNARVATGHRRAVVDPPIAEHLTLTRHQHGLASGIRNARDG